jgi:probable HAF family extracellular repeat protein
MKKLSPYFLAFFYFFSVGHLYAAETYTLFDLGPVGYDSSVATAINNNGVVVGYAIEDGYRSRAFKWVNGHASLLVPSGFIGDEEDLSSAYSINDSNEIVGFTSDGPEYATIWHSDGSFERIYHEWTMGMDINNTSQIVIVSSDFEPATAFCEDGDCEWILLSISEPKAINDLGQVVGWNVDLDQYAFKWEDDILVNLNDLVTNGFEGHLLVASDINDLGQIVGGFDIVTGSDYSYGSYLFTEGHVKDLGFEGASAINDNGQIVGSHFLYESIQEVDEDGLVIHLGGRLYNLNKLIISSVRQFCFGRVGASWCFQIEIEYSDLKVQDINNRGQIVGSAIIGGEEHAVLLKPTCRICPAPLNPKLKQPTIRIKP